MHIYENLLIVGTSHIAAESVREAERVILQEHPSLVALELDAGRFAALQEPNRRRRLGLKEIRAIGIKGYLFAKFGEWIEHKLGDVVGVSPGSEMKKAASVAQAQNIPLYFIDQPIEVTLKKFSAALTWKEKFRFAWDFIQGIFGRSQIKIDLRTVPKEEIIEQILEQFKDRYPNVHRVLVTERNKYMAKKLFRAMPHESKIIAFVGAGHAKEIIQDIKKLQAAN